jgi:hypothetical protein
VGKLERLWRGLGLTLEHLMIVGYEGDPILHF